ncbi:DUF4054 domain-containing protein [Sphingobium sp. BS19]|uniref:DUF4054 domain-containing protein n=1 Tax=Sphingobium sp. BS19 TaxID=3018973 RepID=UPI0022EDA215|nr:DUF4054 domain-containing protein [Sphingobium sp. BS19]GLI99126.1 hypothetical protein Sbs19_29440 [Sphingobium sp. BS19]
MPYTSPTKAEFTTLYTEFAAITDDQFNAWLPKAEQRIGEKYADYQRDGTELLLAHLLKTNSVGISSALAGIVATGATSFKSGQFSASISESVAAQRAKGGYAATIYGQQLADLQRRLFGGPRLVMGIVTCA